jgi:signal transduction histidine kinase
MKIRPKLLIVFSSMLVMILFLLSSYSILTIRTYFDALSVSRMKQVAARLNDKALNDDALFFEQAREHAAFFTDFEISEADSSQIAFVEPQISDRNKIPASIWRATEKPGSTFTYTDENFVFVVSAWTSAEKRLVIRQSRDEVVAALRPIRHIIYTGMLISMAVIMVVSFLTSRSLSKPILQLAAAAKRIDGGDRSQSLSLDRKDEFGDLAEALNRMASQLQQETEKEKALNERLRNFYADISHEIRNPLHALLSSLELLELEQHEPAQRQRYLGVIRGQVERMNVLFSDLLILQKAEHPDFKLRFQPFSLDEAVHDVAEAYEAEARKKNLELRVQTVSGNVMGSKERIEQVLTNLISNAIKFTEKGFVAISMREIAGKIEVSVSDTGCGIDAALHQTIFDRFYRKDASRSRETGGSGLGLAVVKALLKAHGSEILLRSEPGKGSEFRFSLDVVNE